MWDPLLQKIKLSCSNGFDGFVVVVGKTLLETYTSKTSDLIKKNRFYLKNHR